MVSWGEDLSQELLLGKLTRVSAEDLALVPLNSLESRFVKKGLYFLEMVFQLVQK